MNQPDRDEMRKMQRDAEKRLLNMQRKAETAISGNDMPPVPNFVRTGNARRQPGNSSTADLHSEKQKQPEKHDTHRKPPISNSFSPLGKITSLIGGKGSELLRMLNLGNLKFDSDTILIIVLILLLSTDDSDELLLLALVYIML